MLAWDLAGLDLGIPGSEVVLTTDCAIGTGEVLHNLKFSYLKS